MATSKRVNAPEAQWGLGFRGRMYPQTHTLVKDATGSHESSDVSCKACCCSRLLDPVFWRGENAEAGGVSHTEPIDDEPHSGIGA